jgi:uncharacterized membrane protein
MAMIAVYGIVIANVVYFNIKLANSASLLPKEELEFLLYRENKNLNYSIFSSIIAVVTFYVYLSKIGFVITLILICILMGSYASLKKILQFYLNQ